MSLHIGSPSDAFDTLKPSVTKLTMWSRETTVESESLDWHPSNLEPTTSAPCGFVEDDDELAADGQLVMTKKELQNVLVESVRDLPFIVTLASASEDEDLPEICAASRGAQEKYRRTRQTMLGESVGILDSTEVEDFEVRAKLRSVHGNGAEAAVVKKQRKASGEVFTAFQYHRGLSLGSDQSTSSEVWYLLTITFDITADLERESQGTASVDYNFFKESAISISRRVRSNITNALSAISFSQRAPLELMNDEELAFGMWNSDIGMIEGHASSISVTTPEWVSYPPESTDIRRP